MFGTCLEHVWGVFGMCQEVVLNMSGTFLENVLLDGVLEGL